MEDLLQQFSKTPQTLADLSVDDFLEQFSKNPKIVADPPVEDFFHQFGRRSQSLAQVCGSYRMVLLLPYIHEQTTCQDQMPLTVLDLNFL